MYYVVLDSTGNLVESFDEESAARAALDQIVHNGPPGAADHYALLTYDEAGHPVGEAVTIADAGVTA